MGTGYSRETAARRCVMPQRFAPSLYTPKYEKRGGFLWRAPSSFLSLSFAAADRDERKKGKNRHRHHNRFLSPTSVIYLSEALSEKRRPRRSSPTRQFLDTNTMDGGAEVILRVELQLEIRSGA
ncbi:unnamed protein product [Caenorhabditis auriculariae]|uniref:Uncharacterized protein n=1 Tax=Caenorhabditis auriculariae TaxID=2777116 RepID=A0A8S1GSD4_9PELO|nr:unnamed protein product [Caenorhabditis auriculariae]